MTKPHVRRMLDVKSTHVVSVGFDPKVPGGGFGFLIVQYERGGDAWMYKGVSHTEYLNLLNAESIGAELSALKARYVGEKLSTSFLPTTAAAPPAQKGKSDAQIKQMVIDDLPMFDMADEEMPVHPPKRRK